MDSGWPNSELEELIKSAYSDIEDEWFEHTVEWVIELSDDLAVELARISIANLAIRHSGGDLTKFTVSQEGLKHSIYRVLDLMKESVPPNGD